MKKLIILMLVFFNLFATSNNKNMCLKNQSIMINGKNICDKNYKCDGSTLIINNEVICKGDKNKKSVVTINKNNDMSISTSGAFSPVSIVEKNKKGNEVKFNNNLQNLHIKTTGNGSPIIISNDSSTTINYDFKP